MQSFEIVVHFFSSLLPFTFKDAIRNREYRKSHKVKAKEKEEEEEKNSAKYQEQKWKVV